MQHNKIVLFIIFILASVNVLAFFNFDVLMQNHSFCPFAVLDCKHDITSLFTLNEHLSGMQYLAKLLVSPTLFVLFFVLLILFSVAVFFVLQADKSGSARLAFAQSRGPTPVQELKLLKWLALRNKRNPNALGGALVTDLGGP